MKTIRFELEPSLSPHEFIDLLRRSTLAARRPVDELDRIERMLREADIIVTARDGPLLVGVSRAISDFSYCTYLSDLAVDQDYQRQGIGRTLIELTRQTGGPEAMLILLSAPAAESYYPYIGMRQHGSCWYIPRDSG
jgi:GNAT superfamily N-acetyltransferase